MPRRKTAADVDFRHRTVVNHIELAPCRSAGCAVRRQPVACFRRTVASGRQALLQKLEQRVAITDGEVLQAFAVERFVDGTHGWLADGVAQAAGGEQRYT